MLVGDVAGNGSEFAFFDLLFKSDCVTDGGEGTRLIVAGT